MEAEGFEYDYEYDWVIKKNLKRKAAAADKSKQSNQENRAKRGVITSQPKGDNTVVLSEQKKQ